ncbi:NAD-dependent epimerase/dehydratase family protein [Kutzneria kofuensis]|uniref:Nucleoside-diphosphate-sugar epimerase n=1 Tax=Kutzneria kofuensis TaxID=103725 RepID=A0A7W9KD63_9PSEU|nr:NAD-dependent epimerase/dehydratase family protein [Kutzneria kofuensis]MBB5890013.1 nucleoside-diphosphate-sugar epimerase [Kutzneria kofuensis]
MAETVLVTGGTGYVAGWCVAELLKRGYTVRTTVRSAAKGEQVRRAVSTEVDPEDRLGFAVADLTGDDGWAQAMAGVDHVLHVASPLGIDHSGDAESLIVPARDGTLRVLRAATAAGVQRVVMTSAANTASPSSYRDEGVSDETVWTDLNDPTLQPYRRSKTAAERAAWDFMASYDGPTTLTTILPGAVFGPVLSAGTVGSVQIIGRLIRGMPGTPRIGLEIVDVRDLADAHIRAMTSPEAAGQRFLATGEFMWMLDMALALRSGLGEAGAKAPTRNLPNVAVRGLALFDRNLREIMPALGRRAVHTTAKAERVLGWKSRPAAETVVACGQSLLAHNAV